MDLTTLVVLAGIAAVIGWGLAAWRGRIDRADVTRGMLHGLAIAGVILAVTAVLTALLFMGREFLGGAVGLSEAAGVGALVGALLGIGYFLSGMALMPFGLLVRKSRDWALYGTWVAVVIVIFSVGLGWTVYSAYLNEGMPQPTPAPTRPAGLSQQQRAN